MEFTRQRKSEFLVNTEIEESYLVNSNVSWFVRGGSALFTMGMWVYTFVVIYMLLSGLFNHTGPYISKVKTALKVTNQDIQFFFLKSGVLISIIFSILFIWRTYNKRRFGKLNRRKMPLLTTNEEMLNLNLIDRADFEKLHQQKVIVFENNPIKELKVEKKK